MGDPWILLIKRGSGEGSLDITNKEGIGWGIPGYY